MKTGGAAGERQRQGQLPRAGTMGVRAAVSSGAGIHSAARAATVGASKRSAADLHAEPGLDPQTTWRPSANAPSSKKIVVRPDRSMPAALPEAPPASPRCGRSAARGVCSARSRMSFRPAPLQGDLASAAARPRGSPLRIAVRHHDRRGRSPGCGRALHQLFGRQTGSGWPTPAGRRAPAYPPRLQGGGRIGRPAEPESRARHRGLASGHPGPSPPAGRRVQVLRQAGRRGRAIEQHQPAPAIDPSCLGGDRLPEGRSLSRSIPRSIQYRSARTDRRHAPGAGSPPWKPDQSTSCRAARDAQLCSRDRWSGWRPSSWREEARGGPRRLPGSAESRLPQGLAGPISSRIRPARAQLGDAAGEAHRRRRCSPLGRGGGPGGLRSCPRDVREPGDPGGDSGMSAPAQQRSATAASSSNERLRDLETAAGETSSASASPDPRSLGGRRPHTDGALRGGGQPRSQWTVEPCPRLLSESGTASMAPGARSPIRPGPPGHQRPRWAAPSPASSGRYSPRL